jgi:hypothetical protein
VKWSRSGQHASVASHSLKGFLLHRRSVLSVIAVAKQYPACNPSSSFRGVMRRVANILTWCYSLPAGVGGAMPGADVLADADAARRETRVLRQEKVIAIFDHVSAGRWGVTEEEIRGEGKTPLGEYRMARTNPSARLVPSSPWIIRPSIGQRRRGPRGRSPRPISTPSCKGTG